MCERLMMKTYIYVYNSKLTVNFLRNIPIKLMGIVAQQRVAL